MIELLRSYGADPFCSQYEWTDAHRALSVDCQL
jgi:hypothetical protein